MAGELTPINLHKPDFQGFEAPPIKTYHQEIPSLDFREVMNESVSEVNGLDTQAKRMVEALATGKTNDVSGVMMAVQKSNLSFMMLLQIRNKLVDAYDEVMRMRM